MKITVKDTKNLIEKINSDRGIYEKYDLIGVGGGNYGLYQGDFARNIGKWIAKGNGDKKILISSDDEGNSYHNLYYAFTDDYDEINELQNFCDIGDIQDDLENYVILG